MSNVVRLRCLNDAGIREFEGWIRGLADQPDLAPPERLLEDDRYSHEFPLGDVTLERRRFASRGDFARYLNQRFEAARIFHDVDVDGMWEWLSLFYVDDAYPARENGTRRKYALNRYVVKGVERRSQVKRRHLLRSAYLLLRTAGLVDPRAIDLLMTQKLDNYAHEVTNLGERTRIHHYAGALLAARELFFDDESWSTRRGVRDSERGVRRFAMKVIKISESTDLRGMDSTTVLAMLPEVFDTWIEDPARRDEIASLRSVLNAGGFVAPAGSAATPDDRARARRMRNMQQALEEQARQRAATIVDRPVRDDMFRWAVLDIYDRQCAVSRIGIVLEPSGSASRYEVEAAHIVPVARGGDDTIDNGMALTRTLHWAFDNGMFAVEPDYRVRVNQQAKANVRNAWVAKFDGCKLEVPSEPELAPAQDALRWHAENVALA